MKLYLTLLLRNILLRKGRGGSATWRCEDENGKFIDKFVTW